MTMADTHHRTELRITAGDEKSQEQKGRTPYQATEPSSQLFSLPDTEPFLPPETQTERTIVQQPPPRRVDHTYRDFSNFPLEELPTRKRTPTNFPCKLHQILSNPEYSHVSRPRHLNAFSDNDCCTRIVIWCLAYVIVAPPTTTRFLSSLY